MGKLTEQQKQAVLEAIDLEARKLGSSTKVAAKCGVAVATITENMKRADKQHLVRDEMWVKVGKALGVKFGRHWNVVETTNYKIIAQLLDMAQSEAIWVPISEKAGSGKSACIVKYVQDDTTDNVYLLQCEEWSRRAFLINLSRTVGIGLPTAGYLSVDYIAGRVIEFFKQRAATGQPLLILDEADKLRPSALRWLIHLYNKLENELGVVICGTENLKKEIKSGVARAVKGYDEIDSRFGRHFLGLLGATKQDVVMICEANGLTDNAEIEKVWKEAAPVQRVHNGKYYTVVEDMRGLKGIIVRETKLRL